MEEDDYARAVLESCKDKTTIFLFVSKEDEVDTRKIISMLLKEGKRIVAPVVEGDDMFISEVKSLSKMDKGYCGVLEPGEKKEIEKADVDIFFVPGTRFDGQNNRKGRGKGYFDRFLADVKGKKPIIGLCFDDQIIDNMEVKGWDIPVDRVISCRR